MWIDEYTLGTQSAKKDQHSSAKLILIDSHSMNEQGQISDCGTSILLSFDNITNSF